MYFFRNQLKQLREKEKCNLESIHQYETQVKQMENTLKHNNHFIQMLNHGRESYTFKISRLKTELDQLNL